MTAETTEIDTLETALMNAVKPSYSSENGEWGLWCGSQHHAQAILDAARSHLESLKGAATSMQILEVGKDQYGEPLTVMGKANAITALRALLSTRDICKPADAHICDENRGGAINVRHCAAQQTDEALEALKYVSICTRERTLPHKKLDENLSIIKKAILSSSGHLGIQGEWRPIDDNTPHEELLILGWYEGDTFKQEIALASAGERFSNGYSNRWQHGQAKYWMPLPAAPVSMTDEGGE
jgi:hypothetical protein